MSIPSFRPLLRSLSLVLLVAAELTWAAPPTLQLPDGPILPTTLHPNMLLDLSVEFPTVGPAYPRTSYVPGNTYIGNFDPRRCYTYKGKASYKDGKYDATGDDGRYFVPAANASTDHKCSNQFSGNFMNWATSSAIDILRVSLSGGDRVIDLPGNTVLQRAVLPTIFYASGSNFPALTVSAASGVAPRDVTPFSNSTVYIISCRNRVLFSTTQPVSRGFVPYNLDDDGALCDAQVNPEKNLAEYVARVSVCSADEGPRRPDFCTRYGANFKPEGKIQKNADRMHFAAMGYLLDGSSKRYGGVLRAPMGYVGPNQFDAAMQKSANPKTEWDAVTGQLKYTDRGVIAYLNRFGRTGGYKSLDPVGELFYESIRYLQGLQPTPEAISNITDTMKDGFPAYTKWDDPIQASCQKTSIILIADANTHYDYYVPGNTRYVRQTFGTPDIVDVPRAVDQTSTPALDVMSWTHNIGLMETRTHGVDSTTRPALANLETKDTGGAINGVTLEGSYYLAGAAHWANVSELRNDKMKGINAQTYVLDVDEYGSGVLDDSNTRLWTHPRDSQLYLAAKYGAYTPEKDTGVDRDPFDPFWPIPTASTPKSVNGCYSYLWDPNGECAPRNYFLAGDGIRFSQAIQTVFAEQDVRGEAVAMVGTSNKAVTEGTAEYIYQGKFMPFGWAGDLRRSTVSYTADAGLKIAAPDANTPTVILKEPDNPPSATGVPVPPRNIYTYNPIAASPTTPFLWEKISVAQRALLDDGDGRGSGRLHYLRGSTNEEAGPANPTGPFRRRARTPSGVTNLLGDIIHSNPVFVGAPRLDLQGAGYADFATKHKSRAKAVYVGANDGMLHAFSSALDKEYFAYVPNMIFRNLKDLTNPGYQHRAYVDGGIAVSEAKVGSNWKTVLASTMGAGAQGVFALDVSDPQNFSATEGALWEFTDADDPDMGNMYSPPVIAKFQKSVSGGVPTYEYFVVVASGVNNYVEDGAVGTAPAGALFLLSLNKKAGTPWTRNNNYYKFPVSSADIDPKRQSGLSAPALVTGNDGAVRFAYAGDLQGNLWRFAFPADKGLTQVNPYRIFAAADRGGNPQPITAAPSVVYAPDRGFIVLFGTGQYLENADRQARTLQSFYGIRDTLEASPMVARRGVLAKRTLAGDVSSGALTIAGDAFSYYGATAKSGWYFDFVNGTETGERVIMPAQLRFGRVFFNSLIPPTDNTCTPLSSGRSYTLNALTGLSDGDTGQTGKLSNVGVLGTPVIFETNGATSPAVPTSSTYRKSVSQKFSSASFGGKGVTEATSSSAALTAGRLSWREIFNYQELHDVP